MFKKTIILAIAAATFSACGSQPQSSVNNSAVPPVAAKSPADNSSAPFASTHQTERPSGPASMDQNTQGGSPNQMAVDVTDMTEKIDKADKELKAKPTDEKLKQTLAAAYFERAFALTKAAQYRAALGDFRKGLKLDPTNNEAKEMHDQIISIFKSIGREPPKEGEEPAPLSVKK